MTEVCTSTPNNKILREVWCDLDSFTVQKNKEKCEVTFYWKYKNKFYSTQKIYKYVPASFILNGTSIGDGLVNISFIKKEYSYVFKIIIDPNVTNVYLDMTDIDKFPIDKIKIRQRLMIGIEDE